MAACLTYWLDAVAVHQLRENTHTRYTAATRLYLIPGLGRKKLGKLTAKDVRTGTPRPRGFEPLTAEEAREFLAAASGHRLQALFELALHTGLRQRELLGLRWEDLDLAGGVAGIRRTLQRTNSAA